MRGVEVSQGTPRADIMKARCPLLEGKIAELVEAHSKGAVGCVTQFSRTFRHSKPALRTSCVVGCNSLPIGSEYRQSVLVVLRGGVHSAMPHAPRIKPELHVVATRSRGHDVCHNKQA